MWCKIFADFFFTTVGQLFDPLLFSLFFFPLFIGLLAFNPNTLRSRMSPKKSV